VTLVTKEEVCGDSHGHIRGQTAWGTRRGLKKRPCDLLLVFELSAGFDGMKVARIERIE
jgi:hypothetical protein